MSDNEKELGYLGEESLLKPQAFATTRKAGYVEEEVDEWVKSAIANQETLVNEYNALVYRCALAEGRVAELEATLAEAGTTPALEETVPAEEVAPVVEEAWTEEPVVEPVAEPVAETLLPMATVSVRAQQILDSAAKEATEHVQRSLERVAQIEEEATAEAEELRNTTQANAIELLRNAEVEAEAIKTTALTEAQEAVVRRDAALEQAHDLFVRVRSFHEFELAKAEEILSLTETRQEEAVAQAVEELEAEPTSASSSDTYEYAADNSATYDYDTPASNAYGYDDLQQAYAEQATEATPEVVETPLSDDDSTADEENKY